MISQMTDNTTEIPRLGIPSLVMLNDDQHGVKQPDATAFPNGCSMGATWDEALLTQVGLAIGTEARGVHNSELDKSGETGGEGWPGASAFLHCSRAVQSAHDPRRMCPSSCRQAP